MALWGWGWGVGGWGGGVKGVHMTLHIRFANYLSKVKMSNTLTMEEVQKEKNLT